jgi:hypothetical protein
MSENVWGELVQSYLTIDRAVLVTPPTASHE